MINISHVWIRETSFAATTSVSFPRSLFALRVNTVSWRASYSCRLLKYLLRIIIILIISSSWSASPFHSVVLNLNNLDLFWSTFAKTFTKVVVFESWILFLKLLNWRWFALAASFEATVGPAFTSSWFISVLLKSHQWLHLVVFYLSRYFVVGHGVCSFFSMNISEIILWSVKRWSGTVRCDGIVHLFKLINRWLRRLRWLTHWCYALTSIHFVAIWSRGVLDRIIDLMNRLQATTFAILLDGFHARSHALLLVYGEYLELRILYHRCGHSLRAVVVLLRILQRWRLRRLFWISFELHC